VWVGRKASSKERVEAMRNAQGYVTKKGYPSNTLVTRVVDGGEPVEFKALFTSWKERNQTSGLGKQNTGKSLNNSLCQGCLNNVPNWIQK
jgi:hypothetical protein